LDSEISENIIEKTCRELGVNQKQLAEEIGVSKNSVSNWKNGKQNLPDWAIKMFNLLKVQKECIEYKNFVSKYKLTN
jgi:DNA-binding transcriptional regulator YiaG